MFWRDIKELCLIYILKIIIEDDNDNTDNYAYDTLTDTDDIDDL